MPVQRVTGICEVNSQGQALLHEDVSPIVSNFALINIRANNFNSYVCLAIFQKFGDEENYTNYNKEQINQLKNLRSMRESRFVFREMQ
jgi:phosphosulfolactate synthase (CoM biosynthesis protein A)